MSVELAGYADVVELHGGSRSVVLRARRLDDGAAVALKALAPECADRRGRARLTHEHLALRALDCAGVVRVVRARGLTTSRLGLTLELELARGRTLHDLMARGPLEIGTFLPLATKLAAALHGVHERGTVHRDISPANVIYDAATGEPTLIDFGGASFLGATEPVTGPEGTLGYLSPEQTGRLERSVDRRSDLFSLGALFHELLTGRGLHATRDALEILHATVAVVPPHVTALRAEVPNILGDIVARLLAKDPEARYQSADGLAADLEECGRRWADTGPLKREPGLRVPSFELGLADHAPSFSLPNKLYGRGEQQAALLRGIELAGSEQATAIVVSGPAGAGKTSLIDRARRALLARGTRVASAKFDQLRHAQPYGPILPMLRGLVRATCAEGPEARSSLARHLQAIGPDARRLVEAIPDIGPLLGDLATPPPLPLTEAQRRFVEALAASFDALSSGQGAGAAADAPPNDGARLAIVLDDVQWIDAASLALLERLLATSGPSRPLLVIGYRSDEVDASHPLGAALERVPAAALTHVEVGPLTVDEVHELLGDALPHLDAADGDSLAAIVHDKTGGNAFFLREFLLTLHEHGALRRDGASYLVDVDLVRRFGITQNVADLLSVRLADLPPETRELVGVAACIGSQFELSRLGGAADMSEVDVARALWPAVSAGLLVSVGASLPPALEDAAIDEPALLDAQLRFAHDRVQEAAYGMLPVESRRRTHLTISRLLAPLAEHDPARVFEVVDQLDAALDLLTDRGERLTAARLHLRAGQRAASAAAFSAALSYFEKGISLLDAAAWSDAYDVSFGLRIAAAETALLFPDRAPREDHVAVAQRNATTVLDRVACAEIRIKEHMGAREYTAAVDLAVEALAWLDVRLTTSRPTLAQAAFAMGRTWWRVRSCAMALEHLPTATDERMVAAMRLMTTVGPPAYQVSANLALVLFLRIVDLSIDHGLTRYSACGFGGYAFLRAAVFDDVEGGQRYAEVARAMLTRFNATELRPRVEMSLIGMVEARVQPLRHGIEPNRAVHELALQVGDAVNAALAAFNFGLSSLLSGVELDELDKRLAFAVDECRRLGQSWPLDGSLLMRQVVANLRGQAADPAIIDGEHVRWLDYSRKAEAADDKATLAILATYRTMLAYLFGTVKDAAAHAEQAMSISKAILGAPQLGIMHLYVGLARVAAAREAGRIERLALTARARRNVAGLRKLAADNPAAFLHQAELVEAELDALAGHDVDAAALFDKAIADARAGDVVQEVALALERAGRFYKERGRERVAASYFVEARAAWSQWGATAKLAQMDAERLAVRTIARGSSSGSISADDLGLTSHAVDVASMMKAARAISGELRTPRLLQRLTAVIMESAGADHGLLVLERDGDLCVWTRGAVGPEGVAVEVLDPPLLLTSSNVPAHRASVVRFVAMSADAEALVVDDLRHDERFSRALTSTASSASSASSAPCSVACIPLVMSQKRMGVLYLENRLTAGAFSARRVELLQLLSAQAILSLENARLYAELERHSHDLEQTVVDRTSALQERNVELAETLRKLNATQAQLVMQEKLASLGALTAGIAHEVKNPLNFVTNFASLTVDLAKELDEEISARIGKPGTASLAALFDVTACIRENAGRIEEHGLRAARVVDRMTLHARHAPAERSRVDLNGVVAEGVRLAVHAARARFKGHDVKIVTTFDPEVGEVDIVAPNVQRVLINVVDNAIYATWKRSAAAPHAVVPTVTVSTAVAGDRVTVSVHDNGTGAPAEVLARAFEPFFTTKPSGEGTGLGLSISHDIVVQGHQGSMRMESVEGESTRVLIELPRPPRRPAHH